jgi:benzoate/toluate 1,2-dioxygenase beta subunit
MISTPAVSKQQQSIDPVSSSADGRYVDDQLLASVEAFFQRSRQSAERPGCSMEEAFRVQQFLYGEARLLDSRQYEQWLDLLAPDFVYWVPSNHGEANLRDQVSVNFDDRRRIEDRVTFASKAGSFAQTPPSRTLRSLTNVQAWRGSMGLYEATAGLSISAYRRSRTVQFVGHLHVLLEDSAAGNFRIRMKIIDLLDCDEPQGNNTFIL